MDNWKPVTVEWTDVCNTREEYELFQQFVMEMKGLKNSPKPSEWNGICTCGHTHSQHHVIQSVNYTAGHCVIKGCKCRYFIHDKGKSHDDKTNA